MPDAAAIRTRLPHHLQWLRRNLEILERMADGVDETQADRSLVPGGSTLRWLLGHLVATRDVMLTHLAAEPVLDEAMSARFQRGASAADLRPAGPAVSELLALLHAQLERLEQAFAAADEARLAAPSGGSTLGESIEFLVWHDTYHIGQATLYRRGAGLESPIG